MLRQLGAPGPRPLVAQHCLGQHRPRLGEETGAGSADAVRAEKPGGRDELGSSGVLDEHLSEIANSRSKDAATSTSIYGAAANTRPKVLEDAAALSMVTDGAMAHSSDAAKCEEQLTNNMHR